MGWTLAEGDQAAALIYGDAEADITDLALSCSDSGGLEATIIRPEGTLGSDPEFTLASGGAQSRFSTIAEPEPLGDNAVSATIQIPAGNPVIAAFARTGELELRAGQSAPVTMNADAEEREAIGRFIQNCPPAP
jgi:nucleoside-diphosphate-sugar epimerase